MTSFVWNLNQICSFAPLKPEENNKNDSKKNMIYLNNIPEKSPNKSPSNWRPRHIFPKKRIIQTPIENSFVKQKKKLSFNVSPSPGKSPNFIGLLEELKLKNLIKQKNYI